MAGGPIQNRLGRYRPHLPWQKNRALARPDRRNPRRHPGCLLQDRHQTGATPARPDVLAFDHARYLTSVNAIEAKTGLDFLRKLPEADQAVVESGKATAIWK